MTAGLLLDVASDDLGYTESPPSSNRNKFGAEIGRDGEPWCAMAVGSWFRQIGRPLPDVGNGGPGIFTFCPSAVNYARAHGEVVGDPQAGDIVLFDWAHPDGISDHVGIVEKVLADGRLQTIEGNTSSDERGSQSNGGGVFRRVRNRSDVICLWRPPIEPVAGPKNRPLPGEDDLAMLQFMIAPRPDGAWIKAWPVDGGRKLVLVGGRWTDDIPADRKAIIEFPAGVFTLDVAAALGKTELRGEVRVGDAHGAVTVSDSDGDYTWHAA